MPVSTLMRRGGTTAAAPFVPSSITGLVGWFDATQMHPTAVNPASLPGGTPDAWFKADAIGGLADGDPISTWTDSTANAYTLTASLTTRPTYKTSIVNGKPVARFDGSNDSLVMDSGFASMFSGASALTIFAVCDSQVQNVIQNIAVWNWTGGTGGGQVQFGIDDVGARFYHIGRRLNADTIAETVGPTSANGQIRVYSGTQNPSISNGLISYYDDALWGLTTHASTGSTFGTGTGTGRVGSSIAPDSFLNGDIAEIIVWKRVLTTLERFQIGRYLSDKYATAAIPSTDGDVVSTWLDLSGQLNHLSQSATQRPLFKTAIQNGHPVLRFDGTNDVIKSGTVTTINDPFSVFIVGARANTSAAHTYFDGTGTVAWVRGTTATPKYRIWNGTATGTGDTSWHQISAIANGASDALYVDAATIIAPSAQGAPSITNFNVGADAAGAGNWFNGDIAEVLIYNSALSTSDRQSVEAYLKAKWGTP